MSLFDFIRKQFIDVIEWNETEPGVLAWRVPMQDHEIQNGAVLTVREGQSAVFVNEGRIADVFGPGRHILTTRTLPVLTNLLNWDKLFDSPFKSDVWFIATRQQLDQRWGTQQPVTLRDRDFGAVRLRAFGNCSYHVAEARTFLQQVVGSRDVVRAGDVDGQLRGLILQHLADAVAQSGVPFLDLAANQVEFAEQIRRVVAPAFEPLGLSLDSLTLQSVSLPEELQKILDQKIGLGVIGTGNLAAFTQYQTAQAIPKLAEGVVQGGGSIAGDAVGLSAGLVLGQTLGQSLMQGLQANVAPVTATAPAATATTPSTVGSGADEVIALLEKLGALRDKGILNEEEFAAKKAELLKKLV